MYCYNNIARPVHQYIKAYVYSTYLHKYVQTYIHIHVCKHTYVYK